MYKYVLENGNEVCRSESPVKFSKLFPSLQQAKEVKINNKDKEKKNGNK